MAFFTDFANAVKDYPAASVSFSISAPVVVTGTSGSVNINEVWKFTVTVSNGGDVNMKNVTLHISGKSGAQVSSSSAGPWVTTVTTTVISSVPAHGSASTATYYFKAPSSSSAGSVPLVEVHLNGWDANLDYILNNLSDHANPPTKSYSAQVFP